ncbi:MAG: GNAT family N-acetyltransferase [Casimicrobiaceae bacterium]
MRIIQYSPRPSMIDMDIRQLGISDAPTYHALRLRMLRIYPDAFTSSYEEDSEKPLAWVVQRLAPADGSLTDFVLGAFAVDAALVGSIGFSVESRGKQRHNGFIFGMYVAPEFAAQGIGRALLGRCIERARRIPGVEQINLTVTATNHRARRLYEMAGFIAFGIEDRALKVGDVYYAKAHMMLTLDRSTAFDARG